MKNLETMVTYTSKANPFNVVQIKSDDSFVIVGDHNPSDAELVTMVNYAEVAGYNAE